jgi:hypothetical protein
MQQDQSVRQRQLNPNVAEPITGEGREELGQFFGGDGWTIVGHGPFGSAIAEPTLSSERDVLASGLTGMSQQDFSDLGDALLIHGHGDWR